MMTAVMTLHANLAAAVAQTQDDQRIDFGTFAFAV
jgi:hypothetical protein